MQNGMKAPFELGLNAGVFRSMASEAHRIVYIHISSAASRLLWPAHVQSLVYTASVNILFILLIFAATL